MTVKYKKLDKLMHKKRYFSRNDFEKNAFLILLEDYIPENNPLPWVYNSYSCNFNTCDIDTYFKDFVLVESEPDFATTTTSFRLRNKNICSVGTMMQSICPISYTDLRFIRLIITDEIFVIKNQDKRKMPSTLFSCYDLTVILLF